jgi:hypothetical protein
VKRCALLALVLVAGCDPFPLELHPPHDAKHVRTVYSDEGRDVELSFIATDAPWAVGLIDTQLRVAGYERCAKAGAWRKERAVAMVAAEGDRVVVRQLREGNC